MIKTITIKARTGAQSSGIVQVKVWTKSDRIKRALKFGGITWAVALVCVFLPIVHFLLVPFFLISGPFIALYFYKQKSLVEGGEGQCPFCNAKLVIGPGPDKWPIDELCTQCQNNVVII